MTYQVKKFGHYRKRRYYSKIDRYIELPNLIEIQTKSYKKFFDEGFEEVFNEIFPIVSNNREMVLKFNGLKFGKPKFKTIQEAKEKGKNYEAPLEIDIELEYTDGTKKSQHVKSLYFGEYPIMTSKGTFIINGSEKVVIAQLARSQGAFFKNSIDEFTGKNLSSAMIIPLRGTWIEIENDSNDLVHVRIDKNRKLNVVTFLYSFGIPQEVLDLLFGNSPLYTKSLTQNIATDWIEASREVFKKIKQGDPISNEGAKQIMGSLFFDPKKYDLSKPGRYKINKKLSIATRALGFYSARDLTDAKGNVVIKAKEQFTHDNLPILSKLIDDNMLNFEFKTINFGSAKLDLLEIIKDIEFPNETLKLIAPKRTKEHNVIQISDILATFNYFLNLFSGIETYDDIDDLANRRVRTIYELLQNQVRIGLTRIEKNVLELMNTTSDKKATIKNLINSKPLLAVIKEFFNTSQLCQFMDQTNLLSELTNKRRLTALGPNGLSRDRAGVEVRDVHNSHYGRVCPIETPEGPNIGLINNLSTYAKINELGFIETPYLKVVNGKVTNEIEHLMADEENNHYIGQANIKLNKNNEIVDKEVIARLNGEITLIEANKLSYVDVSAKQLISIATSCIPFIENDDANRALMGANMQRQAIPLLRPEAPLVGTGVEYAIARDSGLSILNREDGIVKFVDGTKIIVESDKDKKQIRYDLISFERSNQGTCLTQIPLVKEGQKVEKDQLLTDGPSMEKGELALGQNVLVGFTTWNGYNYEDAIIISERLVKDDVYTSLHIEEYTIECCETKLGEEEITRDIPNVSENSKKYLDEDGIVLVGTEVKEGDILVGKVTPKGQVEALAEEKILYSLFADKSRSVKDSSLRVPIGGAGIVQSIKILSKKDGDELNNEVLKIIKVYIVQKRKIQEGDKIAGRHGNKGVISKILPVEDMPYLADGTPLDLMLNPLGVPSRMNIGQILELHLGLAAKKLNIHVATPVFEGMSIEELSTVMQEANIPEDGKFEIFDGKTGEKFDQKISVGYMYMLKLSHMVEDKIHSRNIGPYSLITQQPLGGKAQNGGQRFGEMEVWALEAYGAAHLLQELLTIKSDDIKGRTKTYESIVWKEKIPKPSTPESFLVLTRELKALGIDVKIDRNITDDINYDKSDYLEDVQFGEEGERSYE